MSRTSDNFIIFRRIRKEMGKDIYSPTEVGRIVTNLLIPGESLSVQTIALHLKKTSAGIEIRPSDLKIKTDIWRVILYPREVVWGYLKELEVKGKISLEKRNLITLDDVLTARLHEIPVVQNLSVRPRNFRYGSYADRYPFRPNR